MSPKRLNQEAQADGLATRVQCVDSCARFIACYSRERHGHRRQGNAAAQRSRLPAGLDDKTGVPASPAATLPCPVGKRHPHHHPVSWMNSPTSAQSTANALRHSPIRTRTACPIHRVVQRGTRKRSPASSGQRYNLRHTHVASEGYPPKSVDKSVDERQSARFHAQLVACRNMRHHLRRAHGAVPRTDRASNSAPIHAAVCRLVRRFRPFGFLGGFGNAEAAIVRWSSSTRVSVRDASPR
jgi:hypothetical protein